MLILTRKIGQSINIGNEVTLTILEKTGSQIKLGIIAPKKIPVHREEIFLKIQAEKKLKEENHE